MKLVIGIDEAGYGPNLGPLVIVASVWSMERERTVEGLLEQLAPEFCAEPWTVHSDFIPLGDSKRIYRSGMSADGLRAGVTFLLNQCGVSSGSLSDLLQIIAAQDADRVENQPWYGSDLGQDVAGSLAGTAEPQPANSPTQARGVHKLRSLGLQFLGYRARILDEQEFNQTVSRLGNKSNALSEWSIGLLRDCVEGYCKTVPSPGMGLRIEGYCDRHGGRKRYAPILSHVFQDAASWFDILEETPQLSRYRSTCKQGDLQVQFQVNGDSLLPAAASSILAKWIRELMMQRLNRYWSRHAGQRLRPTAGYAVDAARFEKEIAPHALRLGHPRHSFWRER